MQWAKGVQEKQPSCWLGIMTLSVWVGSQRLSPAWKPEYTTWRLNLKIWVWIQVSTPVLLLTSPPAPGIKTSICGLHRKNRQCHKCFLKWRITRSFKVFWCKFDRAAFSEKKWELWTGLTSACCALSKQMDWNGHLTRLPETVSKVCFWMWNCNRSFWYWFVDDIQADPMRHLGPTWLTGVQGRGQGFLDLSLTFVFGRFLWKCIC